MKFHIKFFLNTIQNLKFELDFNLIISMKFLFLFSNKTPLHVAIEDENVLVVKALLASTSINPNATSILNNFFDSYRF